MSLIDLGELSIADLNLTPSLTEEREWTRGSGRLLGQKGYVLHEPHARLVVSMFTRWAKRIA